MVLLTGRQAGKKAVIVKCSDEGTKVYHHLYRTGNTHTPWLQEFQDAPERLQKKWARKKYKKEPP